MFQKISTKIWLTVSKDDRREKLIGKGVRSLSRLTVILDTGVFYAFFDSKDQHYLDSTALLTHCLEGRFGQPFTSDYIALETTILTQRKLGADVSLAFVDLLRDSGIRTIAAGEEYYERALERFRGNFPRLSLCDAATIVIMNALGVQALASYDERSFSGLVPEIRGMSYYESLPEEEQADVRKKVQRKKQQG